MDGYYYCNNIVVVVVLLIVTMEGIIVDYLSLLLFRVLISNHSVVVQPGKTAIWNSKLGNQLLVIWMCVWCVCVCMFKIAEKMISMVNEHTHTQTINESNCCSKGQMEFGLNDLRKRVGI